MRTVFSGLDVGVRGLVAGVFLVGLCSACSNALPQARSSEAAGDYQQAIYWYAMAVGDGSLEQVSFDLKMTQLQEQRAEQFCADLKAVADRAWDEYLARSAKGDLRTNNRTRGEGVLIGAKKDRCGQ